jgi:hypothetical protein
VPWYVLKNCSKLAASPSRFLFPVIDINSE